MAGSVGSGGGASRLYRVGLAVAIVAFGGYYGITLLGDLIPLEHFGADFTTTAQTSTVISVDPASPAQRAGLVAGDEIVAAEGRPVHNTLDWASVFARVESRQPLPLTIRRNGQIEQLSVWFRRRPDWPWQNQEGLFIVLARVAQLITLLFAIAIGVRARGKPAVFGFLLLATISIYSVGLPPRMAVWWRALPLPLELLFFIPSISKVLIGFILFTFVCTLLNVRLGGRRAALLSVPFAAFAVWDVIFLASLLHAPELIPRVTGFLPSIILVNFGYVLAALVMLGVHYRTLTDPSERRRLRWILAGSVFGCAAGAPTVAGLWLGVSRDPTLIYHSPIGLQLVYMAFLVMPASFWWAIARGELFDLRFVVRRGLQYVFARRGLLVITPLVVAALAAEAALHQNEPLRQLLRTHGWLYYASAAALIVFRRRRAAWLDALDRRLFRERYDAVKLLREVAAQIRTSEDLKAAAAHAATQIEAALHPEWVTVCSYSSSEPYVTVHAGDAARVTWPRPSRLIEELRTRSRPLEISSRSDSSFLQRVDEVEALDRAGVRLIVPAIANGTGDLMFVLGAKRSGEPYSEEDKNLVHAVAESIGHLAGTLAGAIDGLAEDGGGADPSWNRRVWSLADAVARGSRVDWASQSTDVIADERRQVLFELQALERLMQVHGAPSDRSGSGEAVSRFDRWGDFELREQIGAGRFGTVYRAWDPKLEREVAIKLLTVAGVNRSAYLHEARHLARVRHPHVVHVYGADERDEIQGFWMELVEGRTLSDELRDRGPFTPEETSHAASVLCRALAAVHRVGLVHQDVKAQNVMREPDGRLVLMDLGAVTIGPNRPYWGTPMYMAPELFNGGVASPQSDIYSLGVLLFLLATGEFPVEGKTYEEIAERHGRGDRRRLRDRRGDFPIGMADAIDRALHADLSRRFFSADELNGAMTAAEVT